MRTTRIVRTFGLLFVLFVNPLSAQLLDGFGVYVAYNSTNIKADVEVFEDSMPISAAAAGGYVRLKLTDMLAIQPEVTYTTKGWGVDVTYEGVNSKGTITINYIEMPVLAVYSFGDKFSLLAGPYVSLFQDGEAAFVYSASPELIAQYGDEADYSESVTIELEAEDYLSPEIGFTFGASFNLGRLTLGARASTSLATIITPDDEFPDEEVDDIRHDVLQVLVGFNF